MREVKTENLKITFADDQNTKDAVFERVVKFFLDHQSFCGDSVMQCDAPQIDAPEFLADLVDEVLKFEVEDI